MTYTTHAVPGGIEVRQHDANATVVAYYRRREGRWQYRKGLGDRWCRVAVVPPPVERRIAEAEVGLGTTGEAA